MFTSVSHKPEPDRDPESDPNPNPNCSPNPSPNPNPNPNPNPDSNLRTSDVIGTVSARTGLSVVPGQA